MEDKKVSFSAQDNLTPFMKKVQADAKAMYATFAEEAKKQSNSVKDQNKFITERLRLLKEELDYQKRITAEKLKGAKFEAENAQNDYLSGRGSKENFNKASAYAAQVQNEYEAIESQRRTAKQASFYREEKEEKKSSVFADILKAGLVRDISSMMRQATTAQTGLDLLTPSLGMVGAGAGTLTGTALEAKTLGQIEYATIGAQMGKEFGEMAGQGITRHIQTKERFLAAALGVEALTGLRSQAPNLTQYGLDAVAGAQLEQSIIRSTDKPTNAGQIRDVAALSKWANIDQSTILSYLSTTKMGAGADEKDIAELFTMGVDRSVLGDAVTKMVTIMQAQGANAMSPSAGQAMARVAFGEALGGPFGAIDPRSAGLEAQYQGKLSNPSGSFAQALAYSVLREQNPDLGVVGLMKKRQEGGIKYERGVLDAVGRMTGSEDLNTLLYSQLFGTGTVAFDEARLKGRGSLNPSFWGQDRTPWGEAQLGGGISSGDPMSAIREQAASLTTQMQKDIANVNNAFINGFTDGIEMIATQFENRFLQAFETFIDTKLTQATKGWADDYKTGPPPPPGIERPQKNGKR